MKDNVLLCALAKGQREEFSFLLAWAFSWVDSLRNAFPPGGHLILWKFCRDVRKEVFVLFCFFHLNIYVSSFIS